MTPEDLRVIQKRIGYTFRNVILLQQAFIRDSYIEEDKMHQSNEYLEFVGENVLSMVICEKLSLLYGKVNDLKEYEVEKKANIIDLKNKLLCETILANQIEIFGLNKYVVMGSKDRKRKANNMYSAKAELFKAIIGAIAIDSNYGMFAIKNSIDLMLDTDHYLAHGFAKEANYIGLLQKWSTIGNYPTPRYEFNTNSFSYGSNFFQCTCFVDQINRTFSAKGNNKSEARMNAAKMAYNALKEKGMLFTMKDEVGEPVLTRAINQLQELALKGYFPLPVYDNKEIPDAEHDQVWTCVVSIPGEEKSFTSTKLTKREAKKDAAFQMLSYVLKKDSKK